MRLIWVVLFVWGGCFEEQAVRLPSQFTEAIQVSKREPGAACRTLGAIEGRSRDLDDSAYTSAYDTLRSNAALRGGNYVVIDLINGADGAVIIHGRLFNCGLVRERVAVLPPEVE